MSWPQQEFAGKNGVSTLLQRLSQSPLVRKNLPNTQAILNQYMLDIAQFLTKGQSCPNGHPEINVLMDHEMIKTGLNKCRE